MHIPQTARIYSDASGKVPGWRSAVGLYCKFTDAQYILPDEQNETDKAYRHNPYSMSVNPNAFLDSGEKISSSSGMLIFSFGYFCISSQ